MAEIKDLKSKFILDKDAEQENTLELVERLSRFCMIDKRGVHQFIDKRINSYGLKDRLAIILSARHLGAKLQERAGEEVTIPDTATTEELARLLGEQAKVVNARLIDLTKEHKAVRPQRGVFKIAPYTIARIIDNLEGEENDG